MIEIPVELGPRRYVVSIGHGLAGMLPELIGPLRDRRFVLVASRRVFALHERRLERPLARLGPVSRVLVSDAERDKSRQAVSALHDQLLRAGLGRDGVVLAFGGGVVSDLAGFAAATYMRGIAWVALPTTLLAMVDASVGGKVGVNHPKAKNLIGAFHQPHAVVMDPHFLETLPARERQSGAYEVLKCAVLGDRALFRALRGAPPALAGWTTTELENAIASACRIKAEIVERDEREGGVRRVLNLGHTLGHALEAVTRYRRFTHGEAVGWGLIGSCWIAHRRKLLSESAFDAIASAVDRLGPRPRISDLDADAVLAALRHDKKVRGGRITFVLPSGIGRVVIRSDVTAAEIRRALRVMTAREARMD